MNRDELIREMKATGASWHAALGIYAVILATLVGTASLMV